MQGTQFRIWATQRLRDYIIKGFTLNDERFKRFACQNGFSINKSRIFTPLVLIMTRPMK